MKGEYVWVVVEDNNYPGSEELKAEVFDAEEDAQNFADERKDSLRGMFLSQWMITERRNFFVMRNGEYYFKVIVTQKEIK